MKKPNLGLMELQNAVDTICQQAIDQKEQFEGAAINWADFGCSEAMRVTNQRNDSYLSVIVEEASPSQSQDIYKFFAKRLEALGFNNVEVRFEW